VTSRMARGSRESRRPRVPLTLRSHNPSVVRHPHRGRIGGANGRVNVFSPGLCRRSDGSRRVRARNGYGKSAIGARYLHSRIVARRRSRGEQRCRPNRLPAHGRRRRGGARRWLSTCPGPATNFCAHRASDRVGRRNWSCRFRLAGRLGRTSDERARRRPSVYDAFRGGSHGVRGQLGSKSEAAALARALIAAKVSIAVQRG